MKKLQRFTRPLLLSALAYFSLSAETSAQVTVDNTSQTVEQFVQNVLLGGGVTISNVEYNGAAASVVQESVGEFTDPNSDVGFPNGLIMGSGNVQMATWANTGGGNSDGGAGTMGSDTDLQSITPNQIWDECVIEFDFVPSGDELTFRYAFASEEYPEYVCGSVNDAFGFFLSGNNPAGGTYNALNIALIPDPNNPAQYTNTPVSINTVNPGVAGSSGTASTCDAIDPNWASYNVFYQTNSTTNYEYDGRTTVLTARAAVNCGETYHIKLAIGDGGDNVFDSGVFLEGNSFNSSGLSITANVSQIYEGCPGAYYVVNRPDTTMNGTIGLIIQGDAINGTDYDFIPNTITFDQGAFTDTIWVDVFNNDGDTELADTLEIFIDDSSACGGPQIIILNADPIEVTMNSGDTICALSPINDAYLFTPAVTGGVPGGYSYDWASAPFYNFGPDINAPSVSVSPQVDTWFAVVVTDACGAQGWGPIEFVWNECPVELPNVFTPNGDGMNDFFTIVNMDHYPDAELQVFNRWGKKVYENSNYQNDWDGGNLSDGVYYYILIPNGNTREKEPYSGTVQILGSNR